MRADLKLGRIVTGGGRRLAVNAHGLRQLVHGPDVAHGQQVEPLRARPGKPFRVGGAGDPYRRMRALHRRRQYSHVLEIEEPAVVTERLLLPGLEHDLQRLAHPGLALLDGHAVGSVVVGHEATAYAQLQPAARDLVEHGVRLGQMQRVVQRQQRHRRAQPDARRPGGHRGQHHRREGNHPAVWMKVVLVRPGRIEAQPLAVLQQPQHALVEVVHAAVRLGVIRRQREDAEFQLLPTPRLSAFSTDELSMSLLMSKPLARGFLSAS